MKAHQQLSSRGSSSYVARVLRVVLIAALFAVAYHNGVILFSKRRPSMAMKFDNDATMQGGVSSRTLRLSNFSRRRRRGLTALLPNRGATKDHECGDMRYVAGSLSAKLPPITYLASYPGSGTRIARRLIRALTGGAYRIQDAESDINNIRDIRHQSPTTTPMIMIQTRYPHKSGSLAAEPQHDADARRAVILIRNPIRALPALFDELHASEKHLPKKFHPHDNTGNAVNTEDDTNRASVAEWISWRDRMFETQMDQYAEFVRYWTNRYDGRDRILLSYDDLVQVDESTGIEELIRLTMFLIGGESIWKNMIVDDAACVWRGMFAIDKENDGGLRYRHRRLDSYIIPHPSSVGSSTVTDRPFTNEQLGKMAGMLLRVAEDLNKQINQLLLSYRAEIVGIMKKQAKESAIVSKKDNMVKGESSYHIFHVSPPGTDSPFITNWLMGLFDANAFCTTLFTSPGLEVYQNDKNVPIMTTIVTRTNEMNLIAMYKIFKPSFDEVFFILSKSGTDADQQIDERVCEYDNVLCLQHEEELYQNVDELEGLVRSLTEKFKGRFYSKYFASLKIPVIFDEKNAVARLVDMIHATEVMSKKPIDDIHPKFCVRGVINEKKVVQKQGVQPKRLFYCGSSGSGHTINHSTLGIYIVNAFFPEIVGSPPTSLGKGGNLAIQLTTQSLSDATPNDFLVHHMHQYCPVDVLLFPGKQLHINHPTHGFNAYGKYTPPNKNVYVIGAHDEGMNSIHLPYAMMKWWVLVKSMGSQSEVDVSTMEKLFLPSARPQNTRKEFLLYVNSHYAAHRETAVMMLSKLGPVHALGSCQGNPVIPAIVDASKPLRCQPYADNERPPSIIVPDNSNTGQSAYFNRLISQDFRYSLLMEDANIFGLITERIIDGFMSGTVPIYYGTPEIFDIFNPKAFIYFDINNHKEALDRIQYLEEHPDAYQQLLNEPILANGIHTIEKYFSFEDSIGDGVLKKRVRAKLGFPN